MGRTELGDLEELVDHLARTRLLQRNEAQRLIEDVLSFLKEQPEEFVRRRHRELQRQGLSNAEIFARLDADLSNRRFAAPSYTPRQLRRIVYG